MAQGGWKSLTEARVAVVGCGYWGKNLVRVFDALRALHTICEADEKLLAQLQKQYPHARATSRYQDVLADSRIRAVVLATPAETHARMAQQALESSKDVFVEKPLALTYREGAELVALAERRGAILMVGHLLEYHPAIVQLQELIKSGELGRLSYLYSNRLNLGKVRREENILWSFAPHDIAVLLRLVGSMPLAVNAFGGAYLQPQIADVTLTTLHFPDEVRAHIFVSWLHPYKEQKLVVVGDKKMAVFDDVAKEGKLKVHDKRIEWVGEQPQPKQVSETTLYLPDEEPLRVECEHFVQCIEKRTPSKTDGASGLRVLRVLQTAQQSLNQGGVPIPLAKEIL
jgi:UDP-2-acetamido-3-amino-2,3-dideoxy-glucuronate N-acetyltransferase